MYLDYLAVRKPLKAGTSKNHSSGSLNYVFRASKGFIGASDNVSGTILKTLLEILRALLAAAVLGAMKAVLRTMIPAGQEGQQNQESQQIWTVVVAYNLGG